MAKGGRFGTSGLGVRRPSFGFAGGNAPAWGGMRQNRYNVAGVNMRPAPNADIFKDSGRKAIWSKFGNTNVQRGGKGGNMSKFGSLAGLASKMIGQNQPQQQAPVEWMRSKPMAPFQMRRYGRGMGSPWGGK